MTTIFVKVLAKQSDGLGYKTIVVQDLENNSFGHKYKMLVIFPNWEGYIPEIGDIGYISYKDVVGGVDTWFDGTKSVPYNYTNTIFIKFVKKEDKFSKDIIL